MLAERIYMILSSNFYNEIYNLFKRCNNSLLSLYNQNECVLRVIIHNFNKINALPSQLDDFHMIQSITYKVKFTTFLLFALASCTCAPTPQKASLEAQRLPPSQTHMPPPKHPILKDNNIILEEGISV